MTLYKLMLTKGMPDYIRTDNRPTFVASEVHEWFGRVGAPILSFELGSPWENA